jgi:hypothetical protein
MTTLMRAASKPYSMAVAPDSSDKKRAIALMRSLLNARSVAGFIEEMDCQELTE